MREELVEEKLREQDLRLQALEAEVAELKAARVRTRKGSKMVGVRRGLQASLSEGFLKYAMEHPDRDHASVLVLYSTATRMSVSNMTVGMRRAIGDAAGPLGLNLDAVEGDSAYRLGGEKVVAISGTNRGKVEKFLAEWRAPDVAPPSTAPGAHTVAAAAEAS